MFKSTPFRSPLRHGLAACVLAVSASSLAAAQATPEHIWLKENFDGGFSWEATDPQSGEAMSGRGECEMVFGDLYLRCVHLSPAGAPMGVGVSGYNTAAGLYEWSFYGGGGTAISHGRGERDAAANLSWIEGEQYLADGSQIAFRTETRKLETRGWRYTHFFADGDGGWMPVYEAVFVYDSEAE